VLPAATVAELQRLQPRRIVVLGGTTVLSEAVEEALRPHATDGVVARVAGPSRFDTAAAVSRRQFAAGAPIAYVVTGEAFPDALAAGPAAAVAGGPILLVARDALPSVTAEELRRLRPREVVLVGGSGAVSDGVRDAIATATDGIPVRRVAGRDRFATAALLAGEAGLHHASTAFVATGMDFPDALAGVPAAGRVGAPLLLTRAGEIPSPTGDALQRLTLRRVVLLGGERVLLPAMVPAIEALIGSP
jgi:putative cell wall-binding protein